MRAAHRERGERTPIPLSRPSGTLFRKGRGKIKSCVVDNAGMTVPEFVVAIPARHASTRLPGKPLLPIGGEPMVLHVARRALAAGAREVWVATDDQRIADALHGRGVQVAMSSSECSGVGVIRRRSVPRATVG